MWPSKPDDGVGGIAVGEAERVDLGRVANIPFNPEDTKTWGNGGLTPLLIDHLRRGSPHSMVIGGSGTYKSMALATSLLTWTKSFFCLDPSEELADLVAGELEHRGKKVVLLTIGEEGPNVLDGIDVTDRLAETRVRSIAGRIVGPLQDDDKNARFKKWGRSIILALLADMLWDPDTPAEYKTLRSLRYGLDVGVERIRARLRGIAESSHSRLARSLARSMWDMVEETFSGAYSNATDDTEWLASSSYADLVSGKAYRMSDLVGGNLCVFCQIPHEALEHTPAAARVLAGCHLDAVFAAKGDVNGWVWFPMDETVLVGKDPALKVARDQGRKFRVALQLFYQSEYQIEEVWGRPGKLAWFGSLAWRSYTAVQDLETARDISATLGTFGARAYSQGKNSGKSGRMLEPGTRSAGSNTNEHDISRELAKVHELMQDMREDERITIVRNRKPVRHGAAIGFRRPEIAVLLGKSRYRQEKNAA